MHGKQEKKDTSEQVRHGLARIAAALRHQSWAESLPHQINPAQAQVLQTLARSPEMMRIGGLAHELGLTHATISESVTALERKGLVGRESDPNDQRATLVRLSSKGRLLARRISTLPDLLAESCDAMTPSEQAILLKVLIRVIVSLQGKGLIPVAQMCPSCIYFQPFVHSGPEPHHCTFVNRPFGEHLLRMHCTDFQSADVSQASSAVQALLTASPHNK